MSEQKDQDYYRAWMSHHIVSRRGLFRGLLGAGKRAQQQVELESVRRAIDRTPTTGRGGASFSCFVHRLWRLHRSVSLRSNRNQRRRSSAPN